MNLDGKTYTSIYLRHSYRDGPHSRKRNIANLTHCPEEEIAAIELALKHKGNLAVLGSLDDISLTEGRSARNATHSSTRSTRDLPSPEASDPGLEEAPDRFFREAVDARFLREPRCLGIGTSSS